MATTGSSSITPMEQARHLLSETWNEGRRVLVVLGAGASAAAKIPRMPDIFGQLHDHVKEARQSRKADQSLAKDEARVRELQDWLASLSHGAAPRSIAAMALGMMQRAYETANHSPLSEFLERVWSDFSNEFISDLAKKRSPTKLHDLVAGWALKDRADLISVNFDGLTHRALQDGLDSSRENGSAVVLSEPNEISRYFLGEYLGSGPPLRLVPVIKIWGDVFHAVCTNRQCPQSGIRAPIFRLSDPGGDGKFGGAPCPDCRSPRQLQIFFAGYEEKERSALASMTELLRFVAPRTGCILTIGFSGLWDHALVRFLATVCNDLDKERSWRSEIGDGEMQIAKGVHHSPWINVDRTNRPPLLQELAQFGISPIAVSMDAEAFAATVPKPAESPDRSVGVYGGAAFLEEGKWERFVKERKCCPATYSLLETAAMLQEPAYLGDHALLRQLGIKTRIALAAEQTNDPPKKEADHNRRRHSFGATHLALLWFNRLCEGGGIKLTQVERERLATIIMFSAVNHDIGHIPFTHLAEDVLAEVHWSLQEWTSVFHHDASVLGNCFEDFREAVFSLSDSTAAAIGMASGEFRISVECAIQGRSGRNWIDAIVNSPLDADKLDYVLRDCEYLRQGIHVPIDSEEHSYQWLDMLFRNTRVLPSGLLALEGTAGEHAREFLEERRWLYKHQYHQPGFRALERLAGAVILHWLLLKVPQEITSPNQYKRYIGGLRSTIGDTSAIKGQTARKLLWSQLKSVTHPNGKADSTKGEPELLMKLCEDLISDKTEIGLPSHPRVQEWAKKCHELFKQAFEHWRPEKGGDLTLMQYLNQKAGLTCSQVVYIPVVNLAKAREIIREIETLHPFRAFLDVVVEPRILSYPERRRYRYSTDEIIGECIAVAHRDPDRWGMSTGRWIPLSESVFAERDRSRWAKIMAVSVDPDDPAVHHALDRFRSMCNQASIPTKELDPDPERA